MNVLLPYLNYMQLYILFTFLVSIIYRAYLNDTILRFIILCLFLGEVISLFLVYLGVNINYAYNGSLIIHGFLWLVLVFKMFKYKLSEKILIPFFLLFAIINLIAGEGVYSFNAITFIIGAFIYILTFIIGSFTELKKENFSFFSSNKYFLLFSPVIFFLGMSLIFSFKSHDLGETPIFGKIKLYTFLQFSVNAVYYTFLNLYIYRQKALTNATK